MFRKLQVSSHSERFQVLRESNPVSFVGPFLHHHYRTLLQQCQVVTQKSPKRLYNYQVFRFKKKMAEVETIPPETPGGIPNQECGRLETPKHGAGKLLRGITESMKANVGRPDKQAAREKVLAVVDAKDGALLRDASLIRGWCICPACRVKYDIPPMNVQEVEGAANRIYRYGLGTSDSVQVQNAESVMRALAKVAGSTELTPEQCEALVRGMAEELGCE